LSSIKGAAAPRCCGRLWHLKHWRSAAPAARRPHPHRWYALGPAQALSPVRCPTSTRRSIAAAGATGRLVRIYSLFCERRRGRAPPKRIGLRTVYHPYKGSSSRVRLVCGDLSDHRSHRIPVLAYCTPGRPAGAASAHITNGVRTAYYHVYLSHHCRVKTQLDMYSSLNCYINLHCVNGYP
jgi:hypothetical protein